MEHTFTKALLHKIKFGVAGILIVPIVALSASSKEQDSDTLLLKQAIVALAEKNKALEARIRVLEDKVLPARKGTSTNPYNFEDFVEQKLKNGANFVIARTLCEANVREQPSTRSTKVASISAHNKVLVKGIAKSASGNTWYKIDENAYIYGTCVGFWSER